MDVRRLAAVVALVVALGACRSAAPTGGKGPSPSPSPAGGPWVAVFATGDPDSLEDESALIRRRAPGNVAVQPVSCWEGLAETLGETGDVYVAAVVAATEPELDRAVARVGLEVVFRGPAASMCLD